MHNCLDLVLAHILLTSLRQPKEFNCLAAFPSAAIPIDHDSAFPSEDLDVWTFGNQSTERRHTNVVSRPPNI